MAAFSKMDNFVKTLSIKILSKPGTKIKTIYYPTDMFKQNNEQDMAFFYYLTEHFHEWIHHLYLRINRNIRNHDHTVNMYFQAIDKYCADHLQTLTLVLVNFQNIDWITFFNVIRRVKRLRFHACVFNINVLRKILHESPLLEELIITKSGWTNQYFPCEEGYSAPNLKKLHLRNNYCSQELIDIYNNLEDIMPSLEVLDIMDESSIWNKRHFNQFIYLENITKIRMSLKYKSINRLLNAIVDRAPQIKEITIEKAQMDFITRYLLDKFINLEVLQLSDMEGNTRQINGISHTYRPYLKTVWLQKVDFEHAINGFLRRLVTNAPSLESCIIERPRDEFGLDEDEYLDILKICTERKTSITLEFLHKAPLIYIPRETLDANASIVNIIERFHEDYDEYQPFYRNVVKFE